MTDNLSSFMNEKVEEAKKDGRLSLNISKQITNLKKRREKYEIVLGHYLYHTVTQAFLAVILMTSLFLPDVWTIVNPSNDLDYIFNVCLILCVVVFSTEIVLLCIVQVDYFNSTFFWMDIIGTISCVFDLTYVTDFLANTGGTDTRTLRAARVAKIGAKAGRLSRVTKFLKFFYFNSTSYEDEDVGLPVENISAQLSLVLSQRVALLIMFLVVVSPLISNTVTDFSGSAHLTNLDEIAEHDVYSSSQWDEAALKFKVFYDKLMNAKDNLISDPVWLKVRDISSSNCPTSSANADYFDVTWESTDGGFCRYDFHQNRDVVSNRIIRSQNKLFATSQDHPRYHGHLCNNIPEFAFVCNKLNHIDVLFDNTESSILEAWASITLICVVICLLVVFTAAFKYAVDQIIVQPISKIVSHINTSLDEHILDSVKEDLDEEEKLDSNMAETVMLDKMVKKLTKIVQTTYGAQQNELLNVVNDTMDDNTKAWLTTDYVSGAPQRALLRQSRLTRRLPTSSDLGLGLTVSAELVNSFDLDILSFSEPELTPVIVYMFSRYSLDDEFDIESHILYAFIAKVREGYLSSPQYHNFYHGVDVMHTVYQLLDMTRAGEYFSKLEFFACLVAALAHDLGHLGVNNSFLVKSKHTLALLHNDVSPLENMHASKLYDILRDNQCDIMECLEEEQWTAARKQILTCILNTDMAFHFDNLKKLEIFEEVNGTYVNEFMTNIELGSYPVPECLQDSSNRLLLQEAMLHAADLGNPVMPTKFYKKWVERVTAEFFSQGDKEKELGMTISPMCERESTNIPNMQLGFIEFVVAPFYLTLFNIYPSGLLPLAENLESNFTHYARMRIEEMPEEEAKLKPRIQKLREKMKTSGLDFAMPQDEFTEESAAARKSGSQIAWKALRGSHFLSHPNGGDVSRNRSHVELAVTEMKSLVAKSPKKQQGTQASGHSSPSAFLAKTVNSMRERSKSPQRPKHDSKQQKELSLPRVSEGSRSREMPGQPSEALGTSM